MDFRALWGPETRKWGPKSKIRFPSSFLGIKRDLKKISILVWGHPLKSLRDSKNPCFCHFGQIVIRYHSRWPKQGSKMTKIEIFFFHSKKLIKCFQNPVRSLKKSYGRRRTSIDPLASFGPLSRQFLGQNRHYLLLLIDLYYLPHLSIIPSGTGSRT